MSFERIRILNHLPLWFNELMRTLWHRFNSGKNPLPLQDFVYNDERPPPWIELGIRYEVVASRIGNSPWFAEMSFETMNIGENYLFRLPGVMDSATYLEASDVTPALVDQIYAWFLAQVQ